MKIKLSILTLFLFSTQIIASGPQYNDVLKLQNTLAPFLLSAKGVNGVTVSNCQNEDSKENCLRIYTETKEAEDALNTLFPKGSRVQNSLIDVQFIGPLDFQ